MAKRLLGLTIICLVGLTLRLWQLPTNPPVNRDELAIGYNAFTVMLTGKDEHNQGPYPLNFRSFGDFKLPGLIYTAIPWIKLFGLSLLAIRLPTMILGVTLIPLTYHLMSTLFKSPRLGILAALMLAISPWHVHGSRSVYEPVAALTIQVLGILILIKLKPLWTAIATYLGISILAMFFYNTWLFLFIPMFILVGVTVRPEIFGGHKWRRGLIGLFMIGVLGLSLTLLGGTNAGKYQTTILAFPDIGLELAQERYFLTRIGVPVQLTKLITNIPIRIVYRFAGSYLSAFNPVYLFISGGNNPWHNLSSIRLGEFQLYDLIFIGFALIWTISHKPTKQRRVILFGTGWLLISPLTNALTIDTPNTNRLMDYHYVLTLVSTYGLFLLLNLIKKPLYRSVIYLVIGVFGLYFSLMYFSIYPQMMNSYWQPEAMELVNTIKPLETDYHHIIIRDMDMAYIYFAFFRPIEPQKFITEAVWANDGLDGVTGYKNYQFTVGPYQYLTIQGYLKNKIVGRDTLVISKVNNHQLVGATVFVIRDGFGQPVWQANRIPPVAAEKDLKQLENISSKNTL